MLEMQRDFSNLKGKTATQIKAWLRRLVENNLIDAKRREESSKRRPEGEIRVLRLEDDGIRDENGATASSVMSRNESDSELLRAVSSLPRDQQELLEMRHKRSMSFADIGQALGITEQAAWKRWARIVEQLRQELAHDH